MGAGNSAVVVDRPRCGPMLSPRVSSLVPIPGPRMERETPGQRPRPNYGHPHPLPAEASERAFALARRMALATSEPTELVAVEDGDVVAKATALIATTSSLIALKAVAIARRARGDNPEKVGSDIHDLVRLVHSCDFGAVVDSLATAGDELRDWVGATLVKCFSPEQDLRYAFARLRRLARSTDADSLTEDDLAIVAELGHVLLV